MGITYPKSLALYDLKLRYNNPGNITQTALEQDIGRVCRYKDEDLEKYPLPTVFISRACKDAIMSIVKSKADQKNVDITLIPPANSEKMLLAKNKTSNTAKNHIDLNYCLENYLPGKKNMDNSNTTKEKFRNRYLLFGRPQCGKTGTFLEIIRKIWMIRKLKMIDELTSTSEVLYDSDIEEEYDDDDENDTNDRDIPDKNMEQECDDLNSYDFPPFNILKQMPLNPKYPPKSSRYGDPKLAEDRNHYILHKKTYPPERLLKEEYNSLIGRIITPSNILSQETLESSTSELNFKNSPNEEYGKMLRTDGTKYGSLKLINPDVETDDFLPSDYKAKYNLYTFPFGVLHLNKRLQSQKWVINHISQPSVNQNMKLIPIVICSSGRASTGLFDLSKAMNGLKTYIQIIVIREEEELSYLKLTHNYPNIDVLVLPKGTPHMIGAARKRAKEMSEALFNRFVLLMDDNIRGWSEISFQNYEDTNELIDNDISLLSLLQYFEQNSKEMENYSILGFQFSKRGIKTCKRLFSRRHVYGAVILNLQKTKCIQYDEAWAMEDVNFNLKANEEWALNKNQGVIVKFQRFIASKKAIKSGGVVPYDIPPHLMELIKHSKNWGRDVIENPQGIDKKQTSQKNNDETDGYPDETDKTSNAQKRKTDNRKPVNSDEIAKRRKLDDKCSDNENRQSERENSQLRKELEKEKGEKENMKNAYEKKIKEEKENGKKELERVELEKSLLQKDLDKETKENKAMKNALKRKDSEMKNLNDKYVEIVEKESQAQRELKISNDEKNELMQKNEELQRKIDADYIPRHGVEKLIIDHAKKRKEEVERMKSLHQQEIEKIRRSFQEQIERNNVEHQNKEKELKEQYKEMSDKREKAQEDLSRVIRKFT